MKAISSHINELAVSLNQALGFRHQKRCGFVRGDRDFAPVGLVDRKEQIVFARRREDVETKEGFGADRLVEDNRKLWNRKSAFLSSLAERYGCGVIPIREALSRLSTGGFVQIVEQRGFKVAPVHPKELMDVLSLRIRLESMALRSSIALGNIAWEEQVVASHHRLSRHAAINTSGSSMPTGTRHTSHFTSRW